MSHKHLPTHLHATESLRQGKVPFRLSPLASVIAGVALFAAGSVHAADAPSVAELQAEIARLKDIIAKQATASTPVAAPTAAATTDASIQPTVANTTAAAPEEEATLLGAVTVRARNRIENLQDVPLSVSVVTGKELERMQATDISAIAQRVANVSWNQGNQRTSSLSIRGIGKIGQTEAQDPSVGLIIDGVNYAYNALSSSYDFADVEAVEVTRGPQGTLLGKSTSVGVINVQTRRPSFKPDGYYSIGFGQDNTTLARFAGGGPIVDDLLAWRGSFSFTKGKGDIQNAYNHDQTYTNKDRATGRVQFLLTPNKDLSVRLALESTPRAAETTNGRTINTPTPTTYSNGTTNTLSTDASTRLARRWFSQDPSGYSYAGNYLYGGGKNEVNNDSQRGLVTGNNGATVEVNYNLGSHSVTSITAYKDYHFNAVNDEGTPFDVSRNSGGFFNDYRQISQEVRLTSQPGGFVDYQTGLFLLDVNNSSEYQRVWGNDAGAWFASTAQYNRLDANGAGRYLLQNSLSGLAMAFNNPTGLQKIHNRSAAIFAQADWNLSDEWKVTTGVRYTEENRQNVGSSFIKDQGNAPELSSSTLGGFDSYFNSGTTAVTVLNGNVVATGTAGATVVAPSSIALTTDTTNATLLASANAQADAAALKYFGVTTWSALTSAQKRQLNDAQAIRKAQIGVLFPATPAEAFTGGLKSFVLSPTYRYNDKITGYASWQYGEKAGISQLVNGISSLVKPEKTSAFELGIKTSLLDNTLVFNADLYLMNITDYQQGVRVFDAYTTALNNPGLTPTSPGYVAAYTSATGNASKVRSQGLEIDGVYSGIPYTTVRFAGAFTSAKYVDFTNSAQPNENGYPGAPNYQDVSGSYLAGASRFTFNIGAEYRRPVLGNREFHTDINTAFNSGYNSDTSLSSYGWVKRKFVTDFGIGLSTKNATFDVSLLAKNVFNQSVPNAQTWNSYTPATPRWVGLIFSGKL